MQTKRELRALAEDAERRATTHFRKLYEIENIIKTAREEKTPSVLVVDKIEEVIRRQTK